MKRIFSVIALVVCLAFTLTGCNLIKTNTTELAKDEYAAVQKDMETVLAEYDGGTVTKFDVMQSLNSYAQTYYYYLGRELSASELNDYLKTAVEQEISTRAIQKQFEDRGLALEESEEEIRSEAEENWKSAYDYYLESAEGDTDEEKDIRARTALYELGYTEDRLYQNELANHQQSVVQDAVEAEISEVTDEQLQEAYDKKVAEDEETYSATPASIERAGTDASSVICWYPEGYRTVKHILVKPEDEVLQAVTDARTALSTAQSELAQLNDELAQLDEEETTEAEPEAEETTEAEPEAEETAEESAEPVRTAEEIQADIDAKNAEISDLEANVAQAEQACLDASKERIDEIYAALESGTSFDEVMAQFGEDPGMQSEPAMTTGYYVAEGSTTWDANFTAGAMALSQVGDYSETPVISTSGIHIIYYNSDVVSGPVALEDVHDKLYDSTLSELQTAHYEEELDKWIEELHPQYHLDRWVIGA